MNDDPLVTRIDIFTPEVIAALSFAATLILIGGVITGVSCGLRRWTR